MYDFSGAELAVFLSDVIRLFNDTLSAIYGVPILRFFIVAVLFLVVVSLLSRMVRMSQKGRL